MLRNWVFFLLCLPASFLMGSSVEEMQCTVGACPDWVKYCDFSKGPVPIDSSEINFQCLLIDIQTNWEEKSTFFHYVVKPLTHAGISAAAEVEIDFDPTFERVVVHEIKVLRDGEYFDRLQTSRRSLLHRESQLDSDVYEGELTWVHFLEDVQEGDIVEYSYSSVGSMPYFSSHFATDVTLQTLIPVDRIYRRILVHPDCPLQYRAFNTTIEPQVADLSSDLQEWAWELDQVNVFPYEANQPEWHQTVAHVQLTQYQTWAEVIEKLYPLYALPEDFNADSAQAMQAQVNKWKAMTSNPMELALLALRFVQEKVRYLGFEEGLNGFQPTDPRIVFQRRFGDCKDKTFLLSALLRMMGIDSTPVLVDTTEGKILDGYLPSPFVFNHVILRIDIGGNSYWADSTMNYQGGSSIKDNVFPEYHWGLPIAKGTTGLVKMPELILDRPTEIEATLVVTSEDSAELRIEWAFYGYKAESVRSYIASLGLKNLSDESLIGIQKLYGKGALLHPLILSDDLENNVLTMSEGYRVPLQSRSGKKALKVYSFVIKNYLESGINPERFAPYALYYPVWAKEHIHIENPFIEWSNEAEESVYEHESLFFQNSLEIGGHNADFYYELKHLKDHVPLDSMYEYWEMTNEIEENQLNILTAFKTKAA